ncbi:MFS transporter [Streptomyces sp. NPDC127084]|uniref:MFS transporter n=1 Tax=Streptomyces sp. NPDC127084 TaxID=3347133 RepID=UPI00364C6DB1
MSKRVSRKDRLFAAVWGGQLLSLTGSSAAAITIALTVYAETGSATDLVLITAVGTLTSIYLAPIAGTVADRFPRRIVLIFCNAALSTLSVLLALVMSSDSTSNALWLSVLLGLLFAAGILNAALSVTLAASVRQLRPEADLTRINGVTSLIEAAPTLVGPVLGAAVYAAFSPSIVLLFDAATFGIPALLLLKMRWDEHPSQAPERGRRLFAGAAAGLRFVLGHPDLRRLQISYAAINFCNGLTAAVLTVYVLTASSATDANRNLAMVNTAASVGLLLGSAVAVGLGRRVNRAILIGGSLLAAPAVGRLGLALTAIPLVWAITHAVNSAALQVSNTSLTAIWQERVPPEQQASVFGARRLLGQGPYPVAVLLGGWLLGHTFASDSALTVSAAQVFPRFAAPGGGAGLLISLAAVVQLVISFILLASPHLKRVAMPPQPASTAR